MRLRFGSFVFLLVLSAAQPSATQQTAATSVQRDPQALTVLAQTLKAAGGPAALSAIQDVTGSGNITYYWGGEEVQGTVSVKGRGLGQFRLDAILQNGARSWAVSNGAGFEKDADGTVTKIPYHNTLNVGNLTLPIYFISQLPQDAAASLIYVGLETKNGAQVHHIRTQKTFSSNLDPSGIVSKLTARDFFIDATTFQIVSTLDMVHPASASTIDYPRETQFSDYRAVNGILVPFSITEVATGQRTYSIQLNQVTFNSGLQDSDFAQ
ncbi:MAG: hypothetical protein ACYDHE_16665 [Candidatus Acidiferrales bacterium]